MTECMQWEAWYNRMPGSADGDLHVAGKCRLESSSIQLSLEPGNEGIVDEPEVFVLELKAARPEIGDTMMVDREVEWHGDAGPGIKTVRIQGEATAEVEVRIAT